MSHVPSPPSPRRPDVVLVGAGPGDPGLISLRGVEWLARADVVLYDYLANPALLRHCRRDAELVCLGKHGRDRLLSQEEVDQRTIEAARAGKLVVRLKSGDPIVFARFGEEAAALEQAGLRYEVVPGITAALAAGSHAGIPLTDRTRASAVALVTGHEQAGDKSTTLDFAGLSKFPGTLVFYMGVTHANQWTHALIDAGKPAATPVAVIRRCSWPDQSTIVTTLGEAAAAMQAAGLRPPVIVVVGDVAAGRTAESWFTERPLFGRRVLVTRPDDESRPLAQHLRELGADVVEHPVIAISEPDDFAPLDAALRRASEFDWIVFSSGNGVRAVVERLVQTGRDLRAFAAMKIAAIGPGTQAALAGFRLRADFVPAEFRAEALAEGLAAEAARGAKRFLLIRASRGREVLADTLRAAGASVEQVVAYRSDDVVAADPEVAAALQAGKIDWATVTSSAIAKSLAALFGPALHKTKLASISPVTTATLRELGFEASAEATSYTFNGLANAILAAECDK